MFAVPFEEIAAVVHRSPAAARQLAGRARDRVRRAGPAGAAGAAGAYGDDPKSGDARGGGAYGESVYDTGVFGGCDDGVDPAMKAGADIAGAFFAASREGDFEALLTVLDPDHPVRNEAPAEPPTPPNAGTPNAPRPAAPATTAAQAGAHAEHRGGDAVVGATEVNGTESVTRVCTVRTWAPVPALINGTAGLVWVQDGRPQIAFRFAVHDGEITATELETDLSGLSIVY
jgi:RNA polymerase sigma-70 factor (ECF subfamily)